MKILVEVQADDKTWFVATDNAGKALATTSAVKADKEVAKPPRTRLQG